MTETVAHGRYILSASNHEAGITVPAVPGVPSSVAAASAKAAEAIAARDDAFAEQRACREQLHAAPLVDRANDSAAVSAGKPLPDKRLEPAARQAFALAARRAEACDTAARDLTLELAARIRQERAQWLPEAAAAVEATRQECVELVDRLAGLLDELDSEVAIRDALVAFPTQGSLHGVRFRPAQLRPDPVAALRESLANNPEPGNTMVAGVTMD
jgi:hypothetical protein